MERHAEMKAEHVRTRYRRLFMSVLAALVVVVAALAWQGWSEDSSGQSGDAEASSVSAAAPGAFVVQSASTAPTIPGMMRSPLVRAITYDPDAPLSSQLRALRQHADLGDRYATCILAFALDLCARGADRIITDDYAQAMTEAIAEEAVDRMAAGMALEERHALQCAGLEGERYEDIDRRLLASALAGHAPSMRMFALLASRPGRGVEDPDSEFARAHRRHAEAMLNAAAEAGDPEAVRGVHYAYAMGYITSAFGELPVEKDAAKVNASLLAMARHAQPEDASAMESAVERAVEAMTPAEVERFSRLRSAYDRPALGRETRWRGGEDVMKDFPEVACAGIQG